MNNYYNPYNNNSNMYGGNYYRPPSPTTPIQQTSFFAPQSNIQFATLDEAKAYIITPNSQMIFLDKDKQRCYLKTSDTNGQSRLEIYNLQKQDIDQPAIVQEPAPKIDMSAYAKTESIDQIKADLEALKEQLTTKLNELNRKVELKSTLENLNDSMK